MNGDLTIAELKKIIADMPDDAPVVVLTGDGGGWVSNEAWTADHQSIRDGLAGLDADSALVIHTDGGF